MPRRRLTDRTDTGAVLSVMSTIAFFSTGHWIGGIIALLITLAIAAVDE